jgi:hypothetical protein
MAGTPTQQIIKSIQTRLSGAANAYTVDQLLDYVNEGKDEFWKILVASDGDYFLQSTTTTVAQSNTFIALNTTTREYTLPSDYLKARFIECLTAGYEDVEFVYRNISHPDFQQQRRDATANGSGITRSKYFYSIAGKNTFMLAAYPETTFTLKIWYARAIPDLLIGGSFDETALPFPKSIVDYAVSKIQLSRDPSQWGIWKDVWRQDVVTLVEAATPRSSTDPQFVQGFCE